MPTIRQAKVDEMIKRELAEILQKEMRDPRLALATITAVEVTRDFTLAKVYVSTLGDTQEKAQALRALQGAAGFLRGRLGGVIALRTIPQLVFRHDTGVERGIHMYELLKQEEKFLAENVKHDDAPEAASEESPETASTVATEPTEAEKE
jgi:ribosome-binding factor A